MLKCKVEYLKKVHNRQPMIELTIYNDEDNSKHAMCIDGYIFKEGTYNKIANTLEMAINSLFNKIHCKEVMYEEVS